MKVKDTHKKVLKFEQVSIENNQILDSEGNIVVKIKENLPANVKHFDISVTVILPVENN